MPGNSEGACQAGMVPGESPVGWVPGSPLLPSPQPCHPQSRGEGTEMKVGAEKRLKRGSRTCSLSSDLMGMH